MEHTNELGIIDKFHAATVTGIDQYVAIASQRREIDSKSYPSHYSVSHQHRRSVKAPVMEGRSRPLEPHNSSTSGESVDFAL